MIAYVESLEPPEFVAGQKQAPKMIKDYNVYLLYLLILCSLQSMDSLYQSVDPPLE